MIRLFFRVSLTPPPFAGIDAILSIYDNGLQLTFARQPHTVIFYPIASLIYCASLRYSVIENEQDASIGWRFTTLDAMSENSSKHPPLFCAVLQRTNMLAGDECHCFITKTDDAALTLVRTISEVYANLPSSSSSRANRSPLFYQVDFPRVSAVRFPFWSSSWIVTAERSVRPMGRSISRQPSKTSRTRAQPSIEITSWTRRSTASSIAPMPFSLNSGIFGTTRIEPVLDLVHRHRPSVRTKLSITTISHGTSIDTYVRGTTRTTRATLRVHRTDALGRVGTDPDATMKSSDHTGVHSIPPPPSHHCTMQIHLKSHHRSSSKRSYLIHGRPNGLSFSANDHQPR